MRREGLEVLSRRFLLRQPQLSRLAQATLLPSAVVELVGGPDHGRYVQETGVDPHVTALRCTVLADRCLELLRSLLAEHGLKRSVVARSPRPGV